MTLQEMIIKKKTWPKQQETNQTYLIRLVTLKSESKLNQKTHSNNSNRRTYVD